MATTVVRQTTTVTSSSSSSPVVVSFNTSFITSIGGLFTILELVLGIIVFSLMYNYFGFVCASGIFFTARIVRLLVDMLLFSCCRQCSPSQDRCCLRLFFFFLFHAFGFVLYISGGIAVLAVYSRYASSFAGIIAAAVFALIAAVCHLVPR
uniref:Putative conserved plasma membrane protein n=1 Tax=Ixodes ricinus TaxID=34613 RepID=V5HPL9_IXORI